MGECAVAGTRNVSGWTWFTSIAVKVGIGSIGPEESSKPCRLYEVGLGFSYMKVRISFSGQILI